MASPIKDGVLFFIVILSLALNMLTTKTLLKQNADILSQLKFCKPSIQSHIIKNADSKLIECFSRIIINIINKKIPLTKRQFNKLKYYHKQVLVFLRKKSSLAAKKRALLVRKQRGGFLPLLVAPLLGLLASFAGEAIAKKVIK